MRQDPTSLSGPQNREKPANGNPAPGEAASPTLETEAQGVAVLPEPKPKRVLVVGGHGMLGSDTVIELQGRKWQVTAPNIKELDVTNKAHLEKLRVRDFGNLDWVVNCAAYTDVDKAEDEFFVAHQVNGTAPGALGFICQKNDWRFLHVSTDFVFDGRSTVPYTEEHVAAPLGKYGVSKLMGENNAREFCPNSVIVRTAWLYGPNGKSFPRTIIKAWLEGKDLKVVSDQTGSPTYTADLARVLADFIACDAPAGTYHAAGPDAMTWHDLANLTLETYRDSVLGESREIKVAPITTAEWPTKAVRPRYSVLSNVKTEGLGIAPMRSTPAALLDFCMRLPRQL